MGRSTSRSIAAAVTLLLHAGSLIWLGMHPPQRPAYMAGEQMLVQLTLVRATDGTAARRANQAGNGHRRARAADRHQPARSEKASPEQGTTPPAVAPAIAVAAAGNGQYFLPEQLISHPYPQDDVVLDSACLMHGVAILKLWISEEGKVDRIEATDSTQESQCLDAALQAFSHATFVPGTREGNVAVKSMWFVEISGGDLPVQR